MRSKIFWALVIVLLLFLAYGFLPVKIPDTKQDYNTPNTLLISVQECGCPCPNSHLLKGRLLASDSIRLRYPDLKLEVSEIELVDFPPYERPVQNVDFIYFNQFVVKGHISGADTVFCDPSGCTLVPRFTVESWSMTTYYSKFWLFPKWLAILFIICLLLVLPALVIYALYQLWQRYLYPYFWPGEKQQ